MSNVSFSSNSESKMKNYDYSPFYDGTNSEYFTSQRNQLESSNNDIFDLWVYFNLFPFGEQERDNFDEDNRYYISPTSYITDNDRRENIFSIFKDKTNRLNNDLKKYQYKQRGRKKKDEFNKNNNEDKNYHSKSKQDNVIHKIKVIFIESTMNFINKRYEVFAAKKGNKNAKFLLRIKSEFTESIQKDTNLLFLNTKIKDLFSSDLSGKYTNFNKDYNKTIIKELYQKNEANDVIEIMEKTVEELLQNYINGDYEEEGFYIENDLKNVREKMDNNEEKNVDDYTQYFLETAKNFGKIFRNKIPRRKKGTKQTK